jgi:hypothetical protein
MTYFPNIARNFEGNHLPVRSDASMKRSLVCVAFLALDSPTICEAETIEIDAFGAGSGVLALKRRPQAQTWMLPDSGPTGALATKGSC